MFYAQYLSLKLISLTHIFQESSWGYHLSMQSMHGINMIPFNYAFSSLSIFYNVPLNHIPVFEWCPHHGSTGEASANRKLARQTQFTKMNMWNTKVCKSNSLRWIIIVSFLFYFVISILCYLLLWIAQINGGNNHKWQNDCALSHLQFYVFWINLEDININLR